MTLIHNSGAKIEAIRGVQCSWWKENQRQDFESGSIATVKNMFRFHDALSPNIHLAGLPFPGRKGQTCQGGTEESEHIFDNSYKQQGAASGYA
jgi:hypothetical protein